MVSIVKYIIYIKISLYQVSTELDLRKKKFLVVTIQLYIDYILGMIHIQNTIPKLN